MTCENCGKELIQNTVHRDCFEERNWAKLAPLRTALMEECDTGCSTGYGTLEADTIE
jgi:hypothetical protein